MKLFAEPVGSRHRRVHLVAAVALIALSSLTVACRASADQLYWVNQNVISYSNLDGNTGGYLPISFGAIEGGNGTAIDTANNRIYVSQEEGNQIVWFGLDGVTKGVVNTAGAPVDHPTNIAIDPATQMLYWANAASPGSIGFARVDESGGGTLAQPGSTAAHVEKPTRLAIDMLHSRIYWWNESSKEFSWVAMSGQEGGNLSTPDVGITEPGMMGGIAIEPYSVPEELYYVSKQGGAKAVTGGVFHTDPLLGGEPEKLPGAYTEKNAFGPVGLAFDAVKNRFYWGDSTVAEEPKTAIGTATVFGNAGTLEVFPEAPIHNPVFAALLKEPVSLAEPQLAVATGTTLSCSTGEWEGDHPGASVFAAPMSFSYQWRKSNTPIQEATGSTFTVVENGSYSCQVTAKNAAGETVKTSRPTTYSEFLTEHEKIKEHKETHRGATGVSARLVSAKPIKVKAGGTASIGVDVINSGTATSASTKLCGTVSKQVKKALKPRPCVTVKPVAPGAKTLAKLKVKALPKAKGTYKLTVVVSGATKGSLIAKVQVAGRHRR